VGKEKEVYVDLNFGLRSAFGGKKISISSNGGFKEALKGFTCFKEKNKGSKESVPSPPITRR